MSSDSHAAVAVWRIKLRDEAALDAETLGNTLFTQLVNCNAAQKAVLKDMLPQCIWKQVEEGIAAVQPSSSAAEAAGGKQQQQKGRKKAAAVSSRITPTSLDADGSGAASQAAAAVDPDSTKVSKSRELYGSIVFHRCLLQS